jgi:molybdopterin molybdotransferase
MTGREKRDEPAETRSTIADRGFFDVRMRGFRDRTEVADVIALIERRIAPLPMERVALTSARGRALAETVTATRSVPPFPRAAMDGYALRAEDTFGATPYTPLMVAIIGEALPARPFHGHIGAGQAIRIMTGAPVPAGADAVLPVEQADEKNGQLQIVEPVSPGRHVGRVGEDIAEGQTTLGPPRCLRPQDLGLLASIGRTQVAVIRRPRVALLITGNELAQPGATLAEYQIVDSNSVMLQALIERDGGDPLQPQYFHDDAEAIRRVLTTTDADVILVSGGSSVGREDHVPHLVAELGSLEVHGVALRPASPTGLGFIRDRPVFLLPGNPVSCLCAYDLFARHALRRLAGLPVELPYPRAQLPVASKLVSAVGRMDYVRVRVTCEGIVPLAVTGASLLSTTVFADGFVLVGQDLEGHAPGEVVEVFLYDQFCSRVTP